MIWAYGFDEEEALVAGVGGKRLYLWDANTGQLLRSFTSDQGEFDGLNASAGLSPQGTVAWGVTTSGHYQAWDIATGRSLGSYALGLGAFAVHPTQRYGLHGNGHLLDVVEPETGVRLVRMHQHEVERDWMAQSIDGMVIQSDQRRANTLLDERFKDAQIREDADAVQRRLSALLAPEELWQADAAVHAEVTILASRADGHELAVAVPDWPAEMPILRVVTMVDGVLLPFGGIDPTSAEPGLANWNRKVFVRVKNPGQQTEVVLQVQTSDAATKPVKLTLVASDKNPTLHSGRLFVLVIGVGEHRYPEYNLQYAGADAREIAIFFRTQRAVQYSEILVTQLSDAEASRVAILQALREIAGTAGPEDVALVFFAGHGTRGKRGLYFVPHEGDAEGINHTCVNWEDVATELNKFKSRQTIVWLDCCHSGQLLAKPDGIQREIAEQLLSNARICVMAASKGDQFALEDRSWGHGAFTLALLEALGGRADSDKNLSITMGEVAMYLTKRVPELTKNAQEPEISPLSEEASRVTIARTTD